MKTNFENLMVKSEKSEQLLNQVVNSLTDISTQMTNFSSHISNIEADRLVQNQNAITLKNEIDAMRAENLYIQEKISSKEQEKISPMSWNQPEHSQNANFFKIDL